MIEFFQNEYVLHLVILIGIYLLLAQSFNLTFGVGGLFNLAHVATYSLGAYTTALLSTESNAGFLTCIFASVLLSGLFALLIGAISLRLTQDYFAIGTIAFSAIVSSLLINAKSVTHGVLGISGIPRPMIGGVELYENALFLQLLWVFVLVVLLLYWVLTRSSFARTLRAQAESEHSALALGKNTRLARNFSFFISSATSGLGGAFFAYYLNYIDPSSFMFAEMVFILTLVVVGKPGSFWGVVASTIFLILLPESLRFVEIDSSILGPARQMMYATVLFLVVLWNRNTLFPVQRRV